MEDAQIIKLYFARSEDALGETRRKYGSYLNTVARAILKSPEDREEIPKPMPLAEAVEQLKTDFAGYSLAKTVTIDKIDLQYYGEETPEGWILHPAWVFSGMESAQQLDCAPKSPNPKDEPVAFCYFLDDGFLEVLTSPLFDIY